MSYGGRSHVAILKLALVVTHIARASWLHVAEHLHLTDAACRRTRFVVQDRA